jgi:hypothetical protein
MASLLGRCAVFAIARSRTPKRRYLYLDLHARIRQAGTNHHGSRADLAEVFAQNWPAALEFAAVGQHVSYPYNIAQTRACLPQCGFDIPEALLSLLDQVVRD